jgi:hypothetical protein
LVERRAGRRHVAVNIIVAVVALAVGGATIIQIYRIGDAGAQSVWGNEITHLEQSNAK